MPPQLVVYIFHCVANMRQVRHTNKKNLVLAKVAYGGAA
jgi:hypothetical protein